MAATLAPPARAGVRYALDLLAVQSPIKSSVQAKAPAGKYTYVAWVGGKKFTGAFSLSKDQGLVINSSKTELV